MLAYFLVTRQGRPQHQRQIGVPMKEILNPKEKTLV